VHCCSLAQRYPWNLSGGVGSLGVERDEVGQLHRAQETGIDLEVDRLGMGKRCLQHEHVPVVVCHRGTLGVVVEQSWAQEKRGLRGMEMGKRVRQDMVLGNYVP
jgi:hypothetical protein